MTKVANKDVNKPKKPLSGYLCYCNSLRSTVSTLKFADQTKTLSGQWNKLTEAEKAPYMAMALKDRERYTTAMQGYVPPVVDPVAPVAPGAESKKSDVPKEKKKPSGYILFGADARVALKKENPNLTAPEVMKQVGSRWKALTDAQRETYNARAKTQ